MGEKNCVTWTIGGASEYNLQFAHKEVYKMNIIYEIMTQ